MTKRTTTGGVIIGSSYDEARTRKMNADAQIAELELEKVKGTLCLTDDVVKAWEGVLHACKTRFLSIPSKVARVLASETNPGVCEEILESQMREALAELANYAPASDPVAIISSAPEEETEIAPPKRKRGRPRKAVSAGIV